MILIYFTYIALILTLMRSDTFYLELILKHQLC